MKRSLLTTLALLSATAGLHAADLNGTWNAAFDTQVGKQTYTYELKAEDGKVTGKATGDINGQNKRTVEIKEGKLVGDTVSFVEVIDFQGNEISIAYTGTLRGDEIRFTRQVGDVATEELVARREKPGPDIGGRWQAEFDTQVGPQKYLFDFQVKDGKLSAKATAEAREQKRDVDFLEPNLSGDTVTFVEMRQIQDNEIRIEYTGKVTDQGIRFTRKVGDFGSQEFVATRVAAAAAGATPPQSGDRPRRGGFGGPIELG
ncbi:MAG: hypothetical protein J0L84_20875, partial [Verrucomicrobia bacterium]|nr:hypothetical protein [Verrucomicrobiota bacterium]